MFVIFQSTDVPVKRTAVLRGLSVIIGDERTDLFQDILCKSSLLQSFYSKPQDVHSGTPSKKLQTYPKGHKCPLKTTALKM